MQSKKGTEPLGKKIRFHGTMEAMNRNFRHRRNHACKEERNWAPCKKIGFLASMEENQVPCHLGINKSEFWRPCNKLNKFPNWHRLNETEQPSLESERKSIHFKVKRGTFATAPQRANFKVIMANARGAPGERLSRGANAYLRWITTIEWGHNSMVNKRLCIFQGNYSRLSWLSLGFRVWEWYFRRKINFKANLKFHWTRLPFLKHRTTTI